GGAKHGDAARNGHIDDLEGIGRSVAELSAVGAPRGKTAAIGRDEPLGPGSGSVASPREEWPDIDLHRAGLVRGVGEPSAIGGDCGVELDVRSGQEGKGGPVSLERQRPNVRPAILSGGAL